MCDITRREMNTWELNITKTLSLLGANGQEAQLLVFQVKRIMILLEHTNSQSVSLVFSSKHSLRILHNHR